MSATQKSFPKNPSTDAQPTRSAGQNDAKSVATLRPSGTTHFTFDTELGPMTFSASDMKERHPNVLKPSSPLYLAQANFLLFNSVVVGKRSPNADTAAAQTQDLGPQRPTTPKTP